MKVYVVFWDAPYETGQPEKVFATEAQANEFVNTEGSWNYVELDVIEKDAVVVR